MKLSEVTLDTSVVTVEQLRQAIRDKRAELSKKRQQDTNSTVTEDGEK